MAATQGRGPVGALYDRVAHRYSSERVPPVPDGSASTVRLLVGPANEAEQGYQWARAFERNVPGVSAVAMMGFDPSGYEVRADLRVPTSVYLRSPEWHDAFERFLTGRTHVLHESGLPLLGRLYRTDAATEARVLARAGVRVGALFHGSDLRLPSQHIREVEWSPFRNPRLPSTVLEERAQLNIKRTLELGLPSFVSTPDLLRYLPGSTWCPVVVDPAEWHTERDGWSNRPPVVLHAPSNPLIKGSALIEPVLRRLESEGLIEYRSVTGLKYGQMRQQYAQADIVLDQFLIGSYGVVACEALSAGCVVIAHIDDMTRDAVRTATGLEVPIIQATVDTLEEVLRKTVGDTGMLSEVRARGIGYVEEVHNGRHSAQAVQGFLLEG